MYVVYIKCNGMARAAFVGVGSVSYTHLRAEVAGSYLNWLWWILDPLLFMLVYTFVVRVVFTSVSYTHLGAVCLWTPHDIIKAPFEDWGNPARVRCGTFQISTSLQC